MYDLMDLEKQWEIYHRRKKRPLYLVTGLISLLIGLVIVSHHNGYDLKLEKWIMLDNNNTDTIAQNDVNNREGNITIVSSAKDQKFQIEITNGISKNPYDHAGLEPIMEESIEREKKSVALEVMDSSNTNAYLEVEKRFYETADPDDALFLANTYFNKGEFKKAEYWALQANKIDDTIEESWILFAESKIANGQKEEAVKVLKSYIQKSDSQTARSLLEKIE